LHNRIGQPSREGIRLRARDESYLVDLPLGGDSSHQSQRDQRCKEQFLEHLGPPVSPLPWLKNVTPLRTGKICRKEGSLLRSDFGIIGAEFWFVKHYLPTFLLPPDVRSVSSIANKWHILVGTK